jgi:8-oxo-dGTP diphosphatase
MIIFTMGIIFSSDLKIVYLLRKDHPIWQAGLLNGVGGKLEHGETLLSCMEREALEEAGYAGEWIDFGEMRGGDGGGWNCEIFYSVMEPDQAEPKTCEQEKIEAHPVDDLPKLIPEMVPHLPWLILAALTHHGASDRAKFSLDVAYDLGWAC